MRARVAGLLTMTAVVSALVGCAGDGFGLDEPIVFDQGHFEIPRLDAWSVGQPEPMGRTGFQILCLPVVSSMEVELEATGTPAGMFAVHTGRWFASSLDVHVEGWVEGNLIQVLTEDLGTGDPCPTQLTLMLSGLSPGEWTLESAGHRATFEVPPTP